jgi:GT2 family glycosyltransferase
MGASAKGAGESVPRVLVSVLNYNTAVSALATISAFRSQSYPNMHLQLLDNGSTLDCVAPIRKAFPDLDIVRSPTNRGYTGGNNLALERGRREGFDHVLVCNADIIVEPEAVGYLVETAERHIDAGVVGGVELDFQTGRVRTTGGLVWPNWRYRFQWAVEDEPGGEPDRRVRYVQGALVLFTRRALARDLRFNEDLFMYWDEIDLGWTLRENRLAAYVDRRVRIRHRNRPLSLDPAAGYFHQRNRTFLARRHFSAAKLAGFLLYATLFELPAKLIVRSLQGHPRFGVACVLGYWDGLRGRMGKGRLEKFGSAR